MENYWEGIWENENTQQMPWIPNSNNIIIHLDQAADVINKCFLTLIDWC